MVQNWMEGALGIHDVALHSNRFFGSKVNPIHTFGASDVREMNNSFLAYQPPPLKWS